MKFRAIHTEDVAWLEVWFLDAELRKRMDGCLPLQDWLKNAVRTDLQSNLVAEINNQPVAVVSLDPESVVSAWVGLFVDPSRRNQGLGRRVLHAALQLPEAQTHHVFVANIEADNTASQRCFSAVGFVLEDAAPNEDGLLGFVKKTFLQTATQKGETP